MAGTGRSAVQLGQLCAVDLLIDWLRTAGKQELMCQQPLQGGCSSTVLPLEDGMSHGPASYA